jgi:predicted ferric reductase
MGPILRAIAWAMLYVALISFPLFVLLVGPASGRPDLWWDFSMALGYAGMGVMGLQFVLTARFRRATAPFGMDVIYYFHRWMAVAGIGMVLAHFAILRFRYVDALGAINPLLAPWYMTAGRLALLLFGVVIVTSLWRKQLRLEYDRWRVLHSVISVIAVILTVVHVEGAGYFTAAAWKRNMVVAYALGWLAVVTYIRIYKPWRLLSSPHVVTGVTPQRGNAWTLTVRPEGHGGIRFSPGQFAWLSIGRSPFRAREHPFSFAGSAMDTEQLSFTIKELGDFTGTIGDTRVGERVYVDGPHGVFTVDRHPLAPGFVFVAGGVGIAPIMSMMRTLADRNDPRPLYLIYANDRWDEVIFRDEVAALAERDNVHVTHVLLNPPADWSGETGFVTEEILRRALPAEAVSYTCFLCGPRPMSTAVQIALRAIGVPLRRIHFELFDMV